MLNEIKTTFQCNKCGTLYNDSVAKALIRKRAFPCGQKCPCGGVFCLHADGIPLKKEYQIGGEMIEK